MNFCILNRVLIKKGSYQTHGGNFITNRQVFTDCSVNLQRIFLTQNQIINQVNTFFTVGTSWSAAI